MSPHTVKRFSSLAIAIISSALACSMLAARTKAFWIFPGAWLLLTILLAFLPWKRAHLSYNTARLAILAFAALAGLMIFRISIAERIEVRGRSMEPGIQNGDSLWILKFKPCWRFPGLAGLTGKTHELPALCQVLRRNAIVAFSYPGLSAGQVLVKRIIAIPGDNFEMQEWNVIINGKALAEPYTKGNFQWTKPAYSRPLLTEIPDWAIRMHPMVVYSMQSGLPEKGVVPPDSYLVLGDNRSESLDSRTLGFIPTRLLTGVAVKLER